MVFQPFALEQFFLNRLELSGDLPSLGGAQMLADGDSAGQKGSRPFFTGDELQLQVCPLDWQEQCCCALAVSPSAANPAVFFFFSAQAGGCGVFGWDLNR